MEILCMLLAHVLNREIVHYESERDWPSSMQPKSRGVACRVVSEWCQTSL
jgi:hypothetical protein